MANLSILISWKSLSRLPKDFNSKDLSETDYVQPCHGHEYILKGSLLLETSLSFRSHNTTSSRNSKVFSDIISSSGDDSNSPVITRKNRSWTPFDELDEYKVYRARITGEIASKGTPNVSTHATVKRRVSIDGNEELLIHLYVALDLDILMHDDSKISWMTACFVSTFRRLGSGESLSNTGDLLGINQSFLSQITRRSVEAMEERGLHLLRWPFTVTEIEEIKSNFEKICGLPNYCGSIDDARIAMTLQQWTDQMVFSPIAMASYSLSKCTLADYNKPYSATGAVAQIALARLKEMWKIFMGITSSRSRDVVTDSFEQKFGSPNEDYTDVVQE
ncbi:hypothetical protein POTOM_038730 [Populus tomentosa]|uniref:Uncharacterized protein n=1 Tax=Populus tomentosa TaxID=118781 RepID=A0A8X7YXT4_POPTO|nr:hypothetical protein POTOM_038730 [Populus tomentosa]